MKPRELCVLAAVAIAALVSAPALAQYQVLHGHFGNGGGVRSGGGYGVYDTAGQPVIGISAGAANWVESGFWYCAGISSTVDVAFASFYAKLLDDVVILSWAASASAPVEGFNVYRSETTEEALARVNDALLPLAAAGEWRDESALAGRTYLYRIGAVSRDGESFSPALSVALPPKPTTLYQNYPNPFNPTTAIAFYLADPGRVTLSIYDVRGSRVRTLLDRQMAAGRHAEIWDGANDAGARVGSGVYYCRLSAAKTNLTKKLVIVR